LAQALNRTTIGKFSLPKYVKRSAVETQDKNVVETALLADYLISSFKSCFCAIEVICTEHFTVLNKLNLVQVILL